MVAFQNKAFRISFQRCQSLRPHRWKIGHTSNYQKIAVVKGLMKMFCSVKHSALLNQDFHE